jgi:hypothetical protein
MTVSRKISCPSGYIRRASYKTKSGKRVKSSCIRKTGLFSNGDSNTKTLQMIRKNKQKSMKVLSLSKKMGLPFRERCKKGETLRSGYIRSSDKIGKTSSTIVHPECITKRGSMNIPTRTQKQKNDRNTIIMIDDDHTLSQYGYSDIQHKSKEERIIALTSLITHFIPIKGEMQTYTYLIRALNARYILTKNTNPKVSRIFKSDQKMISKMYKKIKANSM